MALLSAFVSEITEARLRLLAIKLDRTIEDLVSCAVEEAALEGVKHSPSITDDLVKREILKIAREKAEARRALAKVERRMGLSN